MKLKVGQKVRITSSDYLSMNGEGLTVGNTGTVRTIYPPNIYGVEMDNSRKPLSRDGEGWAFRDDELETVSALQQARAAADKGIASSAEHAEQDVPGWGDVALTMVRWFAKVQYRSGRYITDSEGTFWYNPEWTAEECRLWCSAHDLPEPEELRAWGSVIQRALREKLIVKTGGFRATVASNGSVRALYRKA